MIQHRRMFTTWGRLLVVVTAVIAALAAALASGSMAGPGGPVTPRLTLLASTTPTVDTSARYVLVNQHSGKALDVPGGSTADGTALSQYTRNDGKNQQWTFTSKGSGYYTLTNLNSAKLLDISGSSKTAGAAAVQQTASSNTSQQWKLSAGTSGTAILTNRNSGQVLDVNGASTANSAKVQQWTANGGSNQNWTLVNLSSPGTTPTPPTPSATPSTSPSTAPVDLSKRYFSAFREVSDPNQIVSGEKSDFGVTPASVTWFDSWGTGNAFPVAQAKSLWAQGVLPHFTWEPWYTNLSVTDPNQIHLSDIINGKWDSYIKARAAEFAQVGSPIVVRFGHEFNGNWYPWGIANNGNDPQQYVKAYRHVHDLVVAAGAKNVQWAWTFNSSSTPDASYNDPAQAYPGSAYVDWVGIDGYNFGYGPSWDPTGNHWVSFNDTFSAAYAKARQIAPDKPVMIAEVASSEDGGDKGGWINDMNTLLKNGAMPDLKVITWFDQDKEERWSASSSSGSKTAFTNWLHQPYMSGTGTMLAQIPAAYAAGRRS